MAFLNEPGGILAVESLGFPFTLAIGAIFTGMEGTFVGLESTPGKAVQDILLRSLYIAALVGVFDTEDKVAFMLAGEKIIVENRSDASQVQPPCGAWCESKPDFFCS